MAGTVFDCRRTARTKESEKEVLFSLNKQSGVKRISYFRSLHRVQSGRNDWYSLVAPTPLLKERKKKECAPQCFMVVGKLLNDCFERNSTTLSLSPIVVGGTNGGSRAKFGMDCLFFGRFSFFFVVVISGMAFVRWRLACFVCVCVCKKCKQRQLIEVDILVVRGHGRRRARLKGSIDARQMAVLLDSAPRSGQRPRRLVHHAVIVALRVVIIARLRFGRRAELLRRDRTVFIQQRGDGRIVLSGYERRLLRRAYSSVQSGAVVVEILIIQNLQPRADSTSGPGILHRLDFSLPPYGIGLTGAS